MTWAEEQQAWAESLAAEHGARVVCPLLDTDESVEVSANVILDPYFAGTSLEWLTREVAA